PKLLLQDAQPAARRDRALQVLVPFGDRAFVAAIVRVQIEIRPPDGFEFLLRAVETHGLLLLADLEIPAARDERVMLLPERAEAEALAGARDLVEVKIRDGALGHWLMASCSRTSSSYSWWKIQPRLVSVTTALYGTETPLFFISRSRISSRL